MSYDEEVPRVRRGDSGRERRPHPTGGGAFGPSTQWTRDTSVHAASVFVTPGPTRWASLAVWVALLVFPALMACAIRQYPGGSWTDRGAIGYSVTTNFWSDLLRTTALNGQPNPGAPCAQAAMVSLSVSLPCFFLLVSAILRTQHRLGTWVRSLGIFAGLAAVGVVLMPSDRFPDAHGIAISVAAPSGILAVGMAVWGFGSVQPRARLPWALGVALLVAASANAVQYGRQFWLGSVPWPYLPLLQKAATLLLVTWMASVTHLFSQRLKRGSL